MINKLGIFLGIIISSVLLLTVGVNTVQAREETIAYENNIWIEDGETILSENKISNMIFYDSENRNNYSSYQFSKTSNVKTTINGTTITLFSLTIYGTVYFYDDGKVHLYALGSYVSNVHENYSATVVSNSIANSDGSFSMGISEVSTDSSVYMTPYCYFTVSFNYGSAQATYNMYTA